MRNTGPELKREPSHYLRYGGQVNELALFAGAGGGILGGKLLGWRTVCAVELASSSRRVLLDRQRDGYLPRFPIWDDIRTFDGKPWRGHATDTEKEGRMKKSVAAGTETAEGKYPPWICLDCGIKHGTVRRGHLATFHAGDKCGWCGREVNTTEPRDFGYPLHGPTSHDQ
jgi:hypothetical protein